MKITAAEVLVYLAHLAGGTTEVSGYSVERTDAGLIVKFSATLPNALLTAASLKGFAVNFVPGAKVFKITATSGVADDTHTAVWKASLERAFLVFREALAKALST